MLWKNTQNSFVGGRLDKELMGRQDLTKYFQGASEIENMVVRRQGYLSKRFGTEKVFKINDLVGVNGKIPSNFKLVPLSYEKDNGYYVLMMNGRAYLVSKDGVRLQSGGFDKNPVYYDTGDAGFDPTRAEEEAEEKREEDLNSDVVLVHWRNSKQYRSYVKSFTNENVRKAMADIFDQCGYSKHFELGLSHVTFMCLRDFEMIEDVDLCEEALKRGQYFDLNGHTVQTNGHQFVGINRIFFMDGSPEGGGKLTSNGESVKIGEVWIGGEGGVFLGVTKPFVNVTRYLGNPIVENTNHKPAIDCIASVIIGGTITTDVEGGGAVRFRPHASGDSRILAMCGGRVINTRGYAFHFADPDNSVAGQKIIVGGRIEAYTAINGSCYAGDCEYIVSRLNDAGDPIPETSYIYVEHASDWTAGDDPTWTPDMTGDKYPHYILTGIENSQLKDVKYTQSGDTLIITHPLKKPFKIVHDVNDGGKLKRVDFDFQSTAIPSPTITSVVGSGFSASGSFRTVWYAVASVKDGVESKLSAEQSLQYRLPWPNTAHVDISISTEKGADKPDYFHVYKKTSNYFGLIGSVDMRNATPDGEVYSGVFADDYITPDASLTPISKKDHFAYDFPTVAAIHQQRLIFASSKKDPMTLWFSAIGDLETFDAHDSIREDDAMSTAISAVDFPKINHIINNRALVLFAESGEWVVDAVSGNSLSYKTVSAKKQSEIGSSNTVLPTTVGDEIIFAERSGEALRSIRYNYASDGYESQDLTVLSQWMFKANPIVQMVYQQAPDSRIICVLADGSIGIMTYMREHEVCAWTRNRLGGGWKAIRIVTNKAIHNATTEVMLTVERDGVHEVWMLSDDLPIKANAKIDQYIRLDGMEMSNEPIIVQDDMVAVDLNSGVVYEAGERTGGASIIGYPFTSRLVTVYPEPKGGNDTLQMEIKNATKAEVRVIDSSSFRMKAFVENDKSFRKIDLPVKAENGLITLADADVRQVLNGSNNRDGRIEIVHDAPFPLNILSVSTTYQVELADQNGGGNG